MIKIFYWNNSTNYILYTEQSSNLKRKKKGAYLFCAKPNLMSFLRYLINAVKASSLIEPLQQERKTKSRFKIKRSVVITQKITGSINKLVEAKGYQKVITFYETDYPETEPSVLQYFSIKQYAHQKIYNYKLTRERERERD